MSRVAKTTAIMVQVKTLMPQPLRTLKVRGNFSTGGDFNDENVATGTDYDGVEHQHVGSFYENFAIGTAYGGMEHRHVKTVGSYHDHQQCVTCSDVAQMVPKQVNSLFAISYYSAAPLCCGKI